MKCPNCGIETAGEEFCPNCGMGLPLGERPPTTWEVTWRTLIGAAIFIVAVSVALGGTCLVIFGTGSLTSPVSGGENAVLLLGGLLAIVAAVFLFRLALDIWKYWK